MKSPILRLLGLTTVATFGLPFLADIYLATARGASPLAQDFVRVFHNPDPEFYVEGCGLNRLGNGSLLAVVPVVPRLKWSEARRVEHSRCHILRSDDHGATWHKLAEFPYYSAIPWSYQGRLYLFANKGGTEFRNDDMLLLESRDNGNTWSDPVTLFKGHFWNCDTGMVIQDGRLYCATDDLSFGAKRGPCVLSCELSRGPMNPAAWRQSNTVPFPGAPAALVNPLFAHAPSQYLEPNVIELNGRVRVLATVKLNRQSVGNLCAVFDLADDGKNLTLKFNRFNPMPGGQLKFCVLKDPVSKMFWATANLVVDTDGTFDWWVDGNQQTNFWGEGRTGGNDRRTLMLLYSLDGLNWFQAGCVAQAPKVSQSFMYARAVIDGDDLAIISRTSINAPNQHDADYATFHRVHEFRKLALNLFPETDHTTGKP